jgi:hypothetical protein
MLINMQIKMAERHYSIYHRGLNLGHITTFNVRYTNEQKTSNFVLTNISVSSA